MVWKVETAILRRRIFEAEKTRLQVARRPWIFHVKVIERTLTSDEL